MALFTHYHSDHVGKFGELIVNRTIRGSKTSLPFIGPRGARQIVNGLLSAYDLDNKYRKDHHKDKWNEKGMDVKVHEKSPGVVHDEGGVKITMFEVDHFPVKPAMGYRFDYKVKSVVVSGDTKRVPQMTEMAKDCDVLVHEAVNKTLIKRAQKIGGNLVDLSERMWKMTLEMMDYHTSTEEVAEIARDANVKKLVLTHMVPAPATNLAGEALFISGMRKTYKGPIKVGRDGMEIKA